MMRTTKVHHIIFVIGFLDLFGVSLILPLILPMVRDLGISHLAAGCITSLYGAIQLFSSPAVGCWSDVIGRRGVMLISLGATSISYLVLGASQSLTLIVIARSIAGTFKHSQTLCRALLADITSSEDRSHVFGRFNAASSMGFIVGPMLGGHISELHDGFFHVCSLGAAIFFVNLSLCWVFIPSVVASGPRKKAAKTEDGRWEIGRWMTDIDWSVLWPSLTIRFFLSFSTLVYRSNFSLLIAQNFGASPKVIGYLISFQGVVSAVAGLLTGQVSRVYHNPHRELYHSSLLLTVALVGLTLAPSLPLLLLCLVPLCISTAVIRVSSSAITVSLTHPSKIGSVTGVGQSVASVARMVTPLVAGVSQEATMYGPGLVGAATAATGTVMAAYIARVNTNKLKQS